ncbi:hypothetical protein AURDEDRAFT_131178 [Auricularia subglabra TFB-10046 SS5]|uniref:Uncharacterized protein n=1 Tax=Auricularia subglabra (strain TFB-10046 / SS5) TaxID=717982 RepID=J0CVI9_AURST|nr:hypothetical protein AURDEDRAFT_131178 [Auricularia subglabra TFB-10046 SS5]
MATNLPTVFEELAKEKYNLLDSDNLDDFIASLRARWVDYEVNGRKFKASDKSKAIVYFDNNPVVLSLVGLVDGENSQLGEYGNLWMPAGGRSWTPDLNEMSKARFVVNLTYPKGEDIKVDKKLVAKTSNQVLALNKIQSALNAALNKDTSLPAVSEEKITDWIDFEESGGGVHGGIKVTLGNVYSPASRKLKGKDVTELSPKKKTEQSTAPKCDSLGLFDRVPKAHTLQPVESLPVLLADGTSAKARDANDLSTLLYSGRWIRADVQMVIWNIKGSKGNSRAFKLEAINVRLLPKNEKLNPNVKFLKPNSLNETEGEVPQSLLDLATDTYTVAPPGQQDEDTVSDTSSKNNDKTKAENRKRAAGAAGVKSKDEDKPAKKQKQE